MSNILRESPLQASIAGLKPTWGELHAMKVALDFGEPAAERGMMKKLALCDVSALPRLGIKGPGAAAWLRVEGIEPPAGVYGVRRFDGPVSGELEPRRPNGSGTSTGRNNESRGPDFCPGLIAATDRDEYFLEDKANGITIDCLADKLGQGQAGAYRVERQDAAVLLSGRDVPSVMLQTCGFDFDGNTPALVMTRVAGVSGAVWKECVAGMPLIHLWYDAAFGIYLWGELLQIVRENGGDAVGVSCFLSTVD